MSNDCLGKVLWSLQSKPLVWFTLVDIVLRCCSKFSLLPKINPRCFCNELSWTRLLLKSSTGWLVLVCVFYRKLYTSCACLRRSGLKLIFHWWAQICIFRKLSLKVVSVTFLLVCFLCLKESTYETRKNVLYFTPKALFITEIIKF